MAKLEHLRWHAALALAAAVLIERLHWHGAALLTVGVVAERAAVTAWQRLRPKWRQVRIVDDSRLEPSTPPPVTNTPKRTRRPSALMRSLNADCPSCCGLGCEWCAGTGLA
ncbi:MAG: hypothetical protein QOG89_99 [Thermomicrobiales bacterium]|nr:hypothetical protein [Thermomicrobiales bacterium]